MTRFETVAGADLDLKIARGVISPRQSFTLIDRLTEQIDWRQDQIKMFGKTHLVPRLTAWQGDPGTVYSYSNLKLDPAPWTPELMAVRAQVSQLCQAAFNSVLLNRYRGGADGMGWHSDNEPELGAEPLIASLSLGASRKFRLRRKDNHKETINLVLNDGDLVVMAGQSQTFWDHQVPKTTSAVAERINLTFRTIQPADSSS